MTDNEFNNQMTGLIALIMVLNSTRLSKFQRDAIRAEYLLELGFDCPKDFDVTTNFSQ